MSIPSRLSRSSWSEAAWLRWAGLGLITVLALVPLVAEQRPIYFLAPPVEFLASWGARTAVFLGFCLVVVLRAWGDRRTDRCTGLLHAGFAALAAGLTAWHWYWVDQVHTDWQRQGYWEILNFQAGPPHQYRALPYGFVRMLEWLTGDWTFACVAYRWFFTYWFVWGSYRFARLFHAPGGALLTLLPLTLLYPLSVLRYWGQLTDPLSHALLILSLAYAVQDRWLALAMAVGLGVLAKETAVVVIPAYLACHWRQGIFAFFRTLAVTGVAAAAFLAARLPMGWRPGATLNGVDGLMIGTNLGVGEPRAYTFVSPLENYLHPILFVVPFLPFIAWNWRRSDPRLRALFLVLTPLLLFANLCYGWMYESRNYMPLVPVLATLAIGTPKPVPKKDGQR